jgi:hypothetical protein
MPIRSIIKRSSIENITLAWSTSSLIASAPPSAQRTPPTSLPSHPFLDHSLPLWLPLPSPLLTLDPLALALALAHSQTFVRNMSLLLPRPPPSLPPMGSCIISFTSIRSNMLCPPLLRALGMTRPSPPPLLSAILFECSAQVLHAAQVASIELRQPTQPPPTVKDCSAQAVVVQVLFVTVRGHTERVEAPWEWSDQVQVNEKR